jgi:hypothetical protein
MPLKEACECSGYGGTGCGLLAEARLKVMTRFGCPCWLISISIGINWLWVINQGLNSSNIQDRR